MKVYITSRGSYSDYELDRVFATEELALDYLAFYEATKGVDRPNIEVIEAEVLEAPLTARPRYEMTSTWQEIPRAYSWQKIVNGWVEPLERTYAQILGDSPAIYKDDPREEIHISVEDNKALGAGYLATYGVEVRVSVTGWDRERVRKVFGEVKAQQAAELEGIG